MTFKEQFRKDQNIAAHSFTAIIVHGKGNLLWQKAIYWVWWDYTPDSHIYIQEIYTMNTNLVGNLGYLSPQKESQETKYKETKIHSPFHLFCLQKEKEVHLDRR